jgi:GntR family transcriptional regulator / MocR family aminotransferase
MVNFVFPDVHAFALKKLSIAISKNSDTPVYEQLAAELRRLILAKTFVVGEKVPSIRALSESLSIAPTTVRRAFQILIEEGWLEQSHGSGTYISNAFELQSALVGAGVESAVQAAGNCVVAPALWNDTWASRLPRPDSYATESGAPPLSNVLLKPLQSALLNMHSIGSPGGRVELRRQVSDYLKVSRGLNCSEEDVIIVNGIEQARSFIARLFVDAGTKVAVEDPCPLSVKNLFLSFGAELVPIPVDESGLVIEELERSGAPALLHLTPSAQNPTGAVLSRRRREHIAGWAAANNCLIFEEDTGCEFIYESRQTAALTSFDQTGHCIYVGSFEQIIPSHWRFAYMVVPPALREACFRLKLISDRATTPMVQSVCLQLCQSDQISKTNIRNQRHYQKMRDHLVDLLQTLLPSITFAPLKGGLRQAIWLPASVDDTVLAERARNQNAAVSALSPLFSRQPVRPGLVVDFTDATEEQLSRTVSVIKELVAENGA